MSYDSFTATMNKIEHPWLTVTVLGSAAVDEIPHEEFEARRSREARLLKFIMFTPDAFPRPGDWFDEPRAVPQGVGEVFAQRLAQRLRINVPLVELSDKEPYDFEDFVKPIDGGWAVSKRIPAALPIHFFRAKHLTLTPPDIICPSDYVEADGFLHRKFFYERLDKRCPRERSDYPDFPHLDSRSPLERGDCGDISAEGVSNILGAIKWNSTARLFGHVFRAFLYATYAHSSNCLVDNSARLWLIDHENIAHRADVEDIKELHDLVKSSPRVMRLCRRLCQISEADIHRSLQGIQKRYWVNKASGTPHAVLTGESEATDYFNARLWQWRACFGGGSPH